MPLSLNWRPFNYHVKRVTGFSGRASVSTRVRPACVFSSVGGEKLSLNFFARRIFLGPTVQHCRNTALKVGGEDNF